jgi:hypothetical protein
MEQCGSPVSRLPRRDCECILTIMFEIGARTMWFGQEQEALERRAAEVNKK